MTEKTTYTLSFEGGYTEDYITAQNLGFTKTYTVLRDDQTSVDTENECWAYWIFGKRGI